MLHGGANSVRSLFPLTARGSRWGGLSICRVRHKATSPDRPRVTSLLLARPLAASGERCNSPRGRRPRSRFVPACS